MNKIKISIRKNFLGHDVYILVDPRKSVQACRAYGGIGNQVCREGGFVAVYSKNGTIETFKDVEGEIVEFHYKSAAVKVAAQFAA